jgi:hypothetical protein
MLLQAGWRPYGPYPEIKPPCKPFMTLKASNGAGKVLYTIGRNMDVESAEHLLSFYKELHPESDLASDLSLAAGSKQGAAAARSGGQIRVDV